MAVMRNGRTFIVKKIIVFLGANIYGPTALNRLVKGKHIKRVIEASMCLYLVLSKRYMKSLLEYADPC